MANAASAPLESCVESWEQRKSARPSRTLETSLQISGNKRKFRQNVCRKRSGTKTTASYLLPGTEKSLPSQMP